MVDSKIMGIVEKHKDITKQWSFLANSENAELKSLVHSLWASFKLAYSALLELEKTPLLLHSSALIKPV
jgi:hypothetical protein